MMLEKLKKKEINLNRLLSLQSTMNDDKKMSRKKSKYARIHVE